MNSKLRRILLIDDDDATNFLHRRIINSSECAEEIVVYNDAEDALDYLKTEVDGVYPCPELILLDINMPRMDGWEFVEEYKRLSYTLPSKACIYMLTTSVNMDDNTRALASDGIDGFLSKPLTKMMINQVLKDHFPSVRQD